VRLQAGPDLRIAPGGDAGLGHDDQIQRWYRLLAQTKRFPDQPFYPVPGGGVTRSADRYRQAQAGASLCSRAREHCEQRVRGPNRLLEDPVEVYLRPQTPVCAETERMIGRDDWIRL